ncbi:hypothetical protein ABK040_012331 [Willaertia magna]
MTSSSSQSEEIKLSNDEEPYENNTTSPKSKTNNEYTRKALLNIVITLILSITSTGILASTLPQLITKFQAEDESDLNEGNDIFRSASIYHGLLLSLNSLIQLFISPLLGSLSDNQAYGRRSILLFQLTCYCLTFIFFFSSSYFNNFFFLIIARIMNGLTGSILMTSFAYISDYCTLLEERSKAFGLVGFSFGISFSIGPMIGGIIANGLGLNVAFLLAFCLCFSAFVYCYLKVKDKNRVSSVVDNNNQENREEGSNNNEEEEEKGSHLRHSSSSPVLQQSYSSSLNNSTTIQSVIQHPFKHFIHSYGLLFFTNNFTFWVALSLFFSQVANESFYSIWNYYSGFRFQFGPKENGYFLFIVGIGSSIIQGYVLRKLVISKRSGFDELQYVRIAFLCTLLMHLVFAFSSTSLFCYLILVVGLFGGLTDPFLKSIISKQVDEKSQGSVQGAISSMGLIAKILASVVSTYSFNYFGNYVPGIPFLLSSVCIVTAIYLIRGMFVTNNGGNNSPAMHSPRGKENMI